MKLTITLTAVLLYACDTLDMEYVPTQEDIEYHFKAFLIEAEEITGIYGNQDVDSILFSYASKNQNALASIHEKVESIGMNVHEYTDKNIVLSYSRPKMPEHSFYSLEIIKISHNSSKVCMGWLQLDSESPININSTTDETDYANDYFWPKYNECSNT